jgi:hypothetical protein
VDADISEITPEALQAGQSAGMWCVVHGSAIAPLVTRSLIKKTVPDTQ